MAKSACSWSALLQGLGHWSRWGGQAGQGRQAAPWQAGRLQAHGAAWAQVCWPTISHSLRHGAFLSQGCHLPASVCLCFSVSLQVTTAVGGTQIGATLTQKEYCGFKLRCGSICVAMTCLHVCTCALRSVWEILLRCSRPPCLHHQCPTVSLFLLAEVGALDLFTSLPLPELHPLAV